MAPEEASRLILVLTGLIARTNRRDPALHALVEHWLAEAVRD